MSGRPWIENRRVPEGILQVLRSGGRWQDLPGKHLLPRRAGGVPGLGGAGRLAEHLGHVSERVEPAPVIEVSLPRKMGAGVGKNQARQGDEVDGGGRQRECSLGDLLHTAFAAKSG